MPLPQENKCCPKCYRGAYPCANTSCVCHGLRPAPVENKCSREGCPIVSPHIHYKDGGVRSVDIGKVEEWEAEFDEMFDEQENFPPSSEARRIETKSFIRTLLSSHTEKLRKELQKILDDVKAGPEDNDYEAASIMYKGIKSILLNNEEVK